MQQQDYSATALAGFIDHTLLKAEATPDQVRALCDEARQYGFKSVCVNSRFVALASAALAGSGVLTCSVVGFPLGAMASEAKAFEAERAIAAGAAEIDMVIAIGEARAGGWKVVAADIEAVRNACAARVLKVIFETSMLDDDAKRELCRMCTDLGVDFVKTCTGFGGGGATVADVRLMAAASGEAVQVKASGGIRDRATALAMIEAGAARLGTSAGVAIVTGAEAGSGY